MIHIKAVKHQYKNAWNPCNKLLIPPMKNILTCLVCVIWPITIAECGSGIHVLNSSNIKDRFCEKTDTLRKITRSYTEYLSLRNPSNKQLSLKSRFTRFIEKYNCLLP